MIDDAQHDRVGPAATQSRRQFLDLLLQPDRRAGRLVSELAEVVAVEPQVEAVVDAVEHQPRRQSLPVGRHLEIEAVPADAGEVLQVVALVLPVRTGLEVAPAGGVRGVQVLGEPGAVAADIVGVRTKAPGRQFDGLGVHVGAQRGERRRGECALGCRSLGEMLHETGLHEASQVVVAVRVVESQ